MTIDIPCRLQVKHILENYKYEVEAVISQAPISFSQPMAN